MAFETSPVGTLPESESTDDVASPTWLLGVAVASVVLSLAALVLDSVAAHIVGHALASLLPFTLVAMFRRRSVERLIVAGLPPSRQANTAALLILATGFASSLVHAWFIARHLS